MFISPWGKKQQWSVLCFSSERVKNILVMCELSSPSCELSFQFGKTRKTLKTFLHTPKCKSLFSVFYTLVTLSSATRDMWKAFFLGILQISLAPFSRSVRTEELKKTSPDRPQNTLNFSTHRLSLRAFNSSFLFDFQIRFIGFSSSKDARRPARCPRMCALTNISFPLILLHTQLWWMNRDSHSQYRTWLLQVTHIKQMKNENNIFHMIYHHTPNISPFSISPGQRRSPPENPPQP